MIDPKTRLRRELVEHGTHRCESGPVIKFGGGTSRGPLRAESSAVPVEERLLERGLRLFEESPQGLGKFSIPTFMRGLQTEPPHQRNRELETERGLEGTKSLLQRRLWCQ